MSKSLAVPTTIAALAISPADLGDVQTALAENIGADSASVFDLPRITIPAGGSTQWIIPTMEEEITAETIPAVIVAKANVRAYYAQSFEQSGGGPPDCFSNDCVTGQGSPGGLCSQCPFSQFGSASGGGKACAERSNLLLLTPYGVMPYLLSVPPTSLKKLRAYLFHLAGANRPFYSVATDIGLDRTKNKAGVSYSVLRLSMNRTLGPDEVEVTLSFKSALSPLLGTMAATVAATSTEPNPDAYNEGSELPS